MPEKRFEVKLLRPRLSVGLKTLGALTLVFWIPVIGLSAMLFLLFQNTIYDDALDSIKLHLKGAEEVYEERARVLEGLLEQTAYRTDTRKDFSEKDTPRLRALLLDLAKLNNYVDIWIAVDEKHRVIARRNQNDGDVIRIGDALSNALTRRESTVATELVSKEFLGMEGDGLAQRVEDTGMTQFVITPVVHDEKVVGAIVAGMLLTGDPWLGNTVYKRYGAEVALFAGESPETSLLHSTASLPRSIWVLGQRIPEGLKEEISLGRPFYGILDVAGSRTLVASKPIKDSRDRIIGALGISRPARPINAIVLRNIAMGLGFAAAAALVIALVATYFVRADITRPINVLVEAMEGVRMGNIDISVNLETGDEFEKLGEGFNAMADGIRRREDRLKKHHEVARLLMSTLDLEGLLENMLDIVMDVTESHMGIVYLYEEEKDELTPIVKYGTTAELGILKMGEGYPGRAASEKSTFILRPPNDATERVMELGFTKAAPTEVAYVPLVHQDRILGVLVAGSVKEFRNEDKLLFDYLANQISIALDNALMHHKIQELSITDPLTTLFNRRYLNVRLDEEWARSVRHNKSISVVLSDVDNFKSVNDTYGHDKGDEVLKVLAAIFKENSRKEDIVARYGGEEFIIVLPDTTSDEARVLAERIRKTAENHIFEWMGRPATISVGVAAFPEIKAKDFDELVQAADQAMYKAKVAGKNRVQVSEGLAA